MTQFYILNQSFETVYAICQYESLLWVDRYNDTSDFEITFLPTEELLKYAVRDNYIWSSNSEKLMIIEYTRFETHYENGVRFTITGRSLESILERRVLFNKTLFKQNVEDGIRQILGWGFISPDDSSRKISNMKFEYTYDPEINTLTGDYEFEKGTDLLEVVKKLTEPNGLGFKMTLNDSLQFVFKLTKGADRSYAQEKNPWIVFSPEFNNLITDKFETNANYEYRNFFYVEGEVYENKKPTIVTSGTATGLARRERYESGADINHKVTDIDGNETTLTEAEYLAQLNQRAADKLKEYKLKTTIESEVEPKINSEYGVDYFIGDIVQVENVMGFTGRTRVTEFITEHNTSGINMYPTFTGIDEEED